MAGICGVLLVTQCQGDRIFCLFHLLIHHKTKCCWFFFFFVFKSIIFKLHIYFFGKAQRKIRCQTYINEMLKHCKHF